MTTRQNTFLIKRSNVPYKVPPISGLTIGELALNTADAKLYTIYTSGTTGATEVRQIGWDRLSIESGGTVNGDVIINGDLTVTGNTNIYNISASTINPVDYIQFNTTYTGATPTEGRIYWDPENETLNLGHSGGNVVQQIGQELYYLVKNQSGATIENGRVVRATGTLGSSGRILAEYMIADGTIPPKFTLGVATEDIINGDDGFVTEFGLVRGIDTTGTPYGETWNDGDILWVSPTISGGLTNIEPVSPNLHIEMAIVIFADANGSVFVRPHRYPYSYDIQDMGWSGGTENNLDIIQWSSSLGYFELTNTPTLNSLSANTINAVTFSGGTFYGDGSGLTGTFTGFTISDGITTQTINSGNELLFLGGEAMKSTVLAADIAKFDLNITGTTAEPSPANGDKLVIWDASNGEHRNIDWNQLPGAAGGEVNTASNVGGGNGIFAQKVGVDLQFRSLVAGSNITITSGATTLTISSTSSGGSSRVTGSTQTTGSTPTELDKIDILQDNATNLIEVYITAYSSGGTQWGVWKRTLTVTKTSGTVTIRGENADVDKTSSGLNATSVDFTVNGGDIDIDVTGIAATTITWESAYEIIL